MDIYENNSESINKLNNFWETAKLEISQIKTDQITFKSQDLPLARIKKIMKLDEDVKTMMISAEAPILFAKAAEFFIREITLRAWIHTERNKRRTLQRSDITLAVADGDTDQFDFLIDIVPRDEIKSHGSATKREETTHSQPMTQVTGNLNLFGGNTIQLNTQALTSGQLGLVESNGLSVGANIIQTQGNQSNVQNQSHGPVQYVLQLPIGGNNALSGGQTIQIQMLPQSMISNSGDNQTATTLTTSNTVLNGQQQSHIFAIGGNQSNQQTATVVLQPGILSGPSGTSLYSTTPVSLDPQQTSLATVATTASVTTDGDQNSGGHYVLTSIKRDVEEPGSLNQDGI